MRNGPDTSWTVPSRSSTARGRGLPVLLAGVLLLAGCGSESIDAATAEDLQAEVRTIAATAAAGDPGGAIVLARRLKGEIGSARDAGDLTEDRAAFIDLRIDAVIASLEAGRTPADPAPADAVPTDPAPADPAPADPAPVATSPAGPPAEEGAGPAGSAPAPPAPADIPEQPLTPAPAPAPEERAEDEQDGADGNGDTAPGGADGQAPAPGNSDAEDRAAEQQRKAEEKAEEAAERAAEKAAEEAGGRGRGNDGN